MERKQRRRKQRPVRPGNPAEAAIEDWVKVRRCSTVTKGGRRFSFSALVVVGDRKGRIGCGFGKANEVPMAVQKGIQDGKRQMTKVSLSGDTIPHEVIGRFGASMVLMFPASEGTGVIAGESVRAVCELSGIKNILTKAHGPTNPINLVKAAMDGLRQLRSLKDVEKARGVTLR